MDDARVRCPHASTLAARRESMALVSFLQAPMEAVTSAISTVEVALALKRHGVVPSDVAEALRGFIVVSVDADICARAVEFEPVTLRSLDAFHLATAFAVGADGLQVVTYDDRLAEAARRYGFVVAQPGDNQLVSRTPDQGTSEYTFTL